MNTLGLNGLLAQGARACCALAAVLLLGSCGGGGGSAGTCMGSAEVCSGGSGSGAGTGSSASQMPSPDIPSSSVAQTCDIPTQRQFIRSYLNETYLWADEILAVDATPYTPAGYFYSLLVTTPDSSGLAKDRFSFIVSAADADSIATGASIGFGVEWVTDTQGRTRVARILPGSPAAAAGMARGGELAQLISSSENTWYPNTAGATVSFSYRDAPGATARTINLTAAPVQEDAVPLATVVTSPQGRRVGYIAFDAHITGAQDKLITAVRTLAAAGVQDLVLDLRYNLGGYIYIAATLASMVTGPAADGKVLERLQYNGKRQAETDAGTFLFSDKVQYGESTYATGTPLPRLGLPRVYVLATGDTCSASETVINSLRGIDVQVVLVGSTTCGKPYGFSRQDNCGLSLFPIEFKGTNAKGFGDYAAGFSATCPAPDDLGHALGDPAESMLGVALRHVDGGVCTTASTPQSAWLPKAASGMTVPRHPGRLLLPRR